MKQLKYLSSIRAKALLHLCPAMFLSVVCGTATAANGLFDTKEAITNNLINVEGQLLPVISRVTYQFEKRKRSDIREQHFLYNKDGMLVQKKSIFGFGKTTLEHYQYDKSGKLISRSIVKNGAPTSTISYEYNQKGSISKESEKYLNGSTDERLYEYSESGYLLALSLQINGHEVERYTYKYDLKGNKIFSTKYSKVGILGTSTDKTYYEYDNSNHLIKASTDGKTLVGGVLQAHQKSEHTYFYDKNHRLIKEEYAYQSWPENGNSPPEHSLSAKFYIHNPEGLLIKEQHMDMDLNKTSKLAKTINYQYQ